MLRKITDNDMQDKGNIGRPDTPEVGAYEMQRILDELSREVIVPIFNENVEELERLEIEKRVKSGDIKAIRVNADNQLEVSRNGESYEATGASGHMIINAMGNAMPQRGRLKFTGAAILSDNTAENATEITAVQGDKGDKGEHGEKGEQGIQGLCGKVFSPFVDVLGNITWTLLNIETPAPPAPRNIMGPEGPQGIQGVQGVNGVQGIQGASGPQGAKGDKGSTGSTGNVGVKGEQGVQGMPGSQIYHITAQPEAQLGAIGDWAVNTETGDWYESTSYGWQKRGCFVGPVGVRGEAGAQGIQGKTGERGPLGMQGPDGARGPQGIKGDSGLQGVQGVKGDTGTQGPAGPQGVKGDGGEDGRSFTILDLFATVLLLKTAHPTGIAGDAYAVGTMADNDIYIWSPEKSAWLNIGTMQGPSGPQGIQGIQGIQGVQGPRGAQGEKGDRGDAGVQGVQGVKGDTGNVGAQGAKGDTGAQGARGIQGDKGIQGTQGVKGDMGSRMYSIAAAPSPVLGSLNDWAINTINGDIHEKTAAAVWSLRGNIKGPQGIQGVKGEVGAQGPLGGTGPQGAQGVRGAQGIQGIQGPQGIQGVKGDPARVNNKMPDANGSISLTPEDIGALAKNDTAHNSLKLGGQAAEFYLPASGTAYNSNLLDGKNAAYYTNMMQPNLLDNSNFKNPVNQRGESSYTGYVYCIDRWMMSSVGMTYNVSARTLTSTVYNNKNYQFINRVECIDKDLAIGDSVAISAKINGKIYTGTARLVEHNFATASDIPHAFENEAFGAMFITLKGNPKICGLAITPKKALTIDWVKVEKGSIETPYIPVSYAEELSKCLAFFQAISGIRIINRNVQVATGYNYATPISFYPKRITPTINLTTTVGAECNVGVTYVQKSGCSITYQPKDTTVSIVTSAYVSADL